MKKTYLIPQTNIIHINAQMMIANSPEVGLDTTKDVNPDEIEVKGFNHSYNIWDDDWSE